MSKNKDARQIACRAIFLFETGKIRFLSDFDFGSEEREKALAKEIAYGVVRYDILYRNILFKFIKPKSNPMLVRVLLIAMHQIFGMDNIPDHAIVNSTVELIKKNGGEDFTGVVNAVTRKIIEIRFLDEKSPFPVKRIKKEFLPKEEHVINSVPKLFLEHVEAKQLEYINNVPPLCTRLLPEKELTEDIKESVLKKKKEWIWWKDTKKAIEIVKAGICTVQDYSQKKATELFEITKDSFVLDLCSAPGGKSLAFINKGARVISSDISENKLSKMEDSFTKIAQDATLPSFAKKSFDIVLIDAPCTGSGVWGRKPESKERYTLENIKNLVDLQKNILHEASELVKETGKIIYSTCSLSKKENEEVVESLSGWLVEKQCTSYPNKWQAGGYAAALSRKGEGK